MSTRRKRKKSRLSTRITTPILDLLLLPLVVPAALLLKSVRRMGLQRLRMCRNVLIRIGVLPLKKHYYEPFIDARDLRRPLDEERTLPGIDWNVSGQLELLDALHFEAELRDIATPSDEPGAFYLHNGMFECGDAEFLYQLIRARKPRRIVEVGSGHSALIARDALRRNREDTGESATHICIEPYEAPWLGQSGATVLRQRVEDVDLKVFRELGPNDLLFIDSSHVIRPQGDVLKEYLEILPVLQPGVIVHLHDIRSPRDYLNTWVLDRMWLWNEQYLLEGFLTHNRSWKVIAALNLLKHRHFDRLSRVCPFLTPDCEPVSFYIQRVEQP